MIRNPNQKESYSTKTMQKVLVQKLTATTIQIKETIIRRKKRKRKKKKEEMNNKWQLNKLTS
jgi:hypothetical protein